MLRLSNIPNCFAKCVDAGTRPVWVGFAFATTTVVWAFVELPFELLTAQSTTAAALLFMEAILYALITFLMLRGVTWARLTFLFLCGTSIIVIVSGFATKIRFYPVWSALSFIELIAKVGSFVVGCRRWSRPA